MRSPRYLDRAIPQDHGFDFMFFLTLENITSIHSSHLSLEITWQKAQHSTMNTSRSAHKSFLGAFYRSCPLFVLLLAGCGTYNGDTVQTYPVTGKVVDASESPITSGSVVFVPAAGNETGRQAAGEIKSDGSYSLKTPNSGDGASLGEYRIRIETSDTGATVSAPKKKGTIKGKVGVHYADEDTSGLSYTVKAEPNTFNITLSDKPPKPAAGGKKSNPVND